jgi:multidrug efflux pump subunit AcrB/ABC-type multidrug transport system ATPase subunit
MKFIIHRKTLIAMLFTALTMLGFFSYRQLPVEMYPNAQIPYLFVQVYSTLEVDPKYMENQVIMPVEGAIGTLQDVEKIESSAGQANGSIRISYKQGANIKLAYLKLIEKMDEVRPNLPEEFNVQVFKFDMEQLNNMLMTIQVRGSGGVDRVRQVAERDIVQKIQNIDGIANVAVFGGRNKTIEIYLDEEVCKAHNITPSDVQMALRNNSRNRVFAGKVLENKQLTFVNVIADYSELSDIENLIIRRDQDLQLKDIATVFFGVQKETSLSRINGMEAVTLQVTRDAQANVIDVSHEVKELINTLNETLASQDIEIVIQENQADTMERNIDLIIKLALLGGVLAIFILWIFLRNIRLVAVVALVLPISVYTAFNFFYAFDISVNSITLLGMALAIGMLVDNSVVVLENIYRLAGKGYRTEDAVIQGTKEVWRSILAATLTTVMVFLPFVFAKNFLIALMGKHIGVSIISTLLVSLAVALLLVPMITYSFLSLKEKKINFENISIHNRLLQIYRVLLKTCMRKPVQTILSALGLFFITLIISLGISVVSKNTPQLKELKLYVTLPAGTTLQTTDLLVAEVEKKLENVEEKEDVISQIYEEEAVVTIILKKDFQDVRQWSVPKIKQNILDKIRNLRPASFSWDPPASGGHFGTRGFSQDEGIESILGMGSTTEKIIIKGPDFDRMLNFAENVRYYLGQQASMDWVWINIPAQRPEVLLAFDKNLLSLYDIPPGSLLAGLNSFPKTFSSGVKFKQGTEEYDITIRTNSDSEKQDRNLKDLKELPVQADNNSQFEMQDISQFVFDKGLSTIHRANQEKQLVISYKFIDEVNDDKDLLTAARAEVDDLMGQISYPRSISAEIVHKDDTLGEFGFLIIAAIILIYMILASIFESFSTPFVILFSIPMAAIGSLVALIFTGNGLMNANSLIGLIILLGIVVNNGILLIDYSNVLRKQGVRQQRALMMAGLARVRPILITAITTVIALFPLAMGQAEYVTQVGVPFAVTVIGGLSLSTLLTLVYIPTVFQGLQASIRWINHQLPWKRLLMLSIALIGTYFIYTGVDRTLWKVIDLLLLVILIPATLFFVQTGLRQARENLIPADEPLSITIRNLVKIYDRDSRFVREWKSGIKIRKRKGYHPEYKKISDLENLIWQMPLLGFFIYFIYGHLQSGFWFFILPLFLQIGLLAVFKPILAVARWKKIHENRKLMFRVSKPLYIIFLWIFPTIALFLFYKRYSLTGLVFPMGTLWYLGILVQQTANKLHRENININRLTGRMKGLRKGFYRFVKVIPLLGKRKKPFKALKGVSIEIGNGMFGLLGPNGAGKSTLMRIICGILEPSYGQITINNFDICEKREELQGLIGYLPQEFGMYENMTAYDFLQYVGLLKKIHDPKEREERIEYVLRAVHMWESRDQKIGSFSGGMKQRIGIAQILLHLPRILVVDEPTAGLDPRERIRFRNLLVELSKERIVIFSTHIIEDVASSCNRVAVVKEGALKYLGAPIEMARKAENKVWQLDLSPQDFETFKDQYPIIHHMKEGEHIRVRCIAGSQPEKTAYQVKPNLEDAYLYLLFDKHQL